MVALPIIASSVLGGLFDRESAKSTNKANLAANAATIADAQRSREEARNSLTGTAGDVGTTRNAFGGFDSQFTPGSSSDILKQGDVDRATASNTAGSDFKFTIPDLNAAQGTVDRDNALAQSGVDNAFDRATLKTRQTGSPGSSNFDSNLFKAQGDVADKLKMNREQQAINLLNTTKNADLGILQNQIVANQALAPGIKGPGTSASTINASIPLAPQTPDVSGAVDTATGSNLVAQIMQQQALEDNRKSNLDTIRTLGNAGYFGKGTA
jgi:hypothetical protein